MPCQPDRQCAEAKRLVESVDHYRSLFENAPIALREVDGTALKACFDHLSAAGITDFKAYFHQHPSAVRQAIALLKIIAINETSVDLFQADSKANLLAHLEQTLLPESFAALRDEIIALAEGQVEFQTETVRRTLQGDKVYLSLKLTVPPDARENLARIFVAMTDITDLRMAQETSAQLARALAHSNAELEQFAYVASHDLQEPLRMVTSYLQLLSRRYRGQLDQNADEFIDFAVDGAKRMRALINGLLTYSRLNTQAREPAPVNCEAVLGWAKGNLGLVIEETKAHIESAPLPMVMADSLQLEQLFQNLLGNALKFRSQAVPHIAISAESEGEQWRFAVRDNGIGFEPEFAERIFAIFQRLHSHEKYAGTGIGLAVCKKIVERHGGQIWCQSAPGQGTTFFFTLPALV